jgi:hypothetical protein
MKKTCFLVILFLLVLNLLISNAQNLTQTIRGKVVDKETQGSLPSATVVIEGTNPLLGTATDTSGYFIIKGVPLGRYNLKVSFLGYEQLIINEVLIGSGKEVVLNVELKESLKNLDEVVIKSTKGETSNSMAIVSARQFSVEEAGRYAGGFDDPVRLASSFAGVAGSLGSNGIVIRGNAPKGLLWRMEGVEISNPSHFADVTGLGAGALTALSSQMLRNSDFYTGAFPAEYGNALSGVFDIKLRTGNTEKRECTFQVGGIGIDFSSEGPFKKGGKASYLFNYRYSTLALFAPILPAEMGILKYQDLCFKLNFPTKSLGTFSIWSISALDHQGRKAISDSTKWKSDTDREDYNTDLFMGAIGFNHLLIFGSKTYINTTFAPTGNGLSYKTDSYDRNLILLPDEKLNNKTWKYTLTSFVNHKFNSRLTNKTGFIINRTQYNIDIQSNENNNSVLMTYAKEKGKSYLIQGFTQLKLDLSKQIVVNFGLHTQFFALNKHYSIEPRLGFKWNYSSKASIGFSYGLHSQNEQLNYYLVQKNSGGKMVEPNKNLDFSKAHHFVLSYEIRISEILALKIEPYYQKLYDVPVIPGSYYSLQNLEKGLFFNDSLINAGKGSNKGVDLTLERYLKNGFYYLFTASVFDSKYTGGDHIERNSRFNKQYVFNLLAGKEWIYGKNKNKIISVNVKFNYMGGDWYNPINVNASMDNRSIVEDLSRAFEERKPDAKILSFSFIYRKNHPKHSDIWSLNLINALGYREFNGYHFDKLTNSIKKENDLLMIPNVSYKIEF